MKFVKSTTLLLTSALLATACDDEGFCIKGQGDTETRVLTLADFEGVDVNGSTKVYIEQGSPQHVEVRGQGNVLDVLETDVENGVWDIEFNRCLRKHDAVEVYITVPELHVARVNGSGSVELQDLFESADFQAGVSGSGDLLLRLAAERLDADISGSGTIRAAGMANQQDISISGSGKYRAFDLSSKIVNADISGSGQAEVNAEEQLNVEISGSGRVYYTGDPVLNSGISGSGKVIKN